MKTNVFPDLTERRVKTSKNKKVKELLCILGPAIERGIMFAREDFRKRYLNTGKGKVPLLK